MHWQMETDSWMQKHSAIGSHLGKLKHFHLSMNWVIGMLMVIGRRSDWYLLTDLQMQMNLCLHLDSEKHLAIGWRLVKLIYWQMQMVIEKRLLMLKGFEMHLDLPRQMETDLRSETGCHWDFDLPMDFVKRLVK
jgi:hypothetical protein